MKFYSLENCKKLQAFGCVSNSGFFHVPGFNKVQWRHGVVTGEPLNDEWTTAFTNLDFLDTTETARENCRKRWPAQRGDCAMLSSFDRHRYAMLDSPDGEKYVMEGL